MHAAGEYEAGGSDRGGTETLDEFRDEFETIDVDGLPTNDATEEENVVFFEGESVGGGGSGDAQSSRLARRSSVLDSLDSAGDGRQLCRRCVTETDGSSAVQFASSRAQFIQQQQQQQQHRCKTHGPPPLHHRLLCPIPNCDQSAPSMLRLQRHLVETHDEPLELHYRVFASAREFELWRELLEARDGHGFVQHTKQAPPGRRQAMQCALSERQRRAAVPLGRDPQAPGRQCMLKECGCCPAYISYRSLPDGRVDAFYQLTHVGHRPEGERRTPLDYGMLRSNWLSRFARPIAAAASSTTTTTTIGRRPMQYLQVDVLEMPAGTMAFGCDNPSRSRNYNALLLVTCLQSRFRWARPIPSASSRVCSLACHLLDICSQFGCPEGVASSFSSADVHEAVGHLQDAFCVEIVTIMTRPPDYGAFRDLLLSVADAELGSRSRWPDAVPFAIARVNQSDSQQAAGEQTPSSPSREHRVTTTTPFQRMFGGRRAWNRTNDRDEDAEERGAGDGGSLLRRGDRVFVRLVERLTTGERQCWLRGVVAETALRSRVDFPYRCHVMTTTASSGLDVNSNDRWPDENSPSVWVSAADVQPATVGLLLDREPALASMVAHFECACGRGGGGGGCKLPRAELCTFKMSRRCCRANNGARCAYHREAESRPSYLKLQELVDAITSPSSAKQRSTTSVHERGVHLHAAATTASSDNHDKQQSIRTATPPPPPLQAQHRSLIAGAATATTVRGDGDAMMNANAPSPPPSSSPGKGANQRRVMVATRSAVAATTTTATALEEESKLRRKSPARSSAQEPSSSSSSSTRGKRAAAATAPPPRRTASSPRRRQPPIDPDRLASPSSPSLFPGSGKRKRQKEQASVSASRRLSSSSSPSPSSLSSSRRRRRLGTRP